MVVRRASNGRHANWPAPARLGTAAEDVRRGRRPRVVVERAAAAAARALALAASLAPLLPLLGRRLLLRGARVLLVRLRSTFSGLRWNSANF